MKQYVGLWIGLLLTFTLSAQDIGQYSLIVEDISFSGIPGVQAFVIGEHDGKWLVFGGRTDGLHRRQPWAAFWEEDNNKQVYVIDPARKQVWSDSLNQLPVPIFEQLQSTNMEFEQVGDLLYVIGGYGYSASVDDHITYPNLTVIDVPQAISAIVNEGSLLPHFRQITDSRIQVTGGYLGSKDGFFYLVGGQKFMGMYNPMGPTHGPGFVQEYTNQIKKFKVLDDGLTLFISDYSALTDTANLHRRDYNMLPQIFPDRKVGFTAFSGVFQHDVNLPWLNTVDIFDSTYAVNQSFNQYLNQYHTASVPIYDSTRNEMYSVFFGGISRYYIDAGGTMIDNQQVPFVNTISMVKREAKGDMTETKIGEMPALLGSSAELILNQNEVEVYAEGIIKLNHVNKDTIIIGHILGGIESTQPNISFLNNGTQSSASSKIFAVKLVKQSTSGVPLGPSLVSDLNIRPNPSQSGSFMVEWEMAQQASFTLEIFDAKGRKIKSVIENRELAPGSYKAEVNLAEESKGLYHLRIFDGRHIFSRKLIKQ